MRRSANAKDDLSGSLRNSMKSTDTEIARFVNREREQFKEDHYEMNVVVAPGRTRKFIFDCDDPIFKLVEPTLDIVMSNNCAVCEKDI